MRDEVLLDAPYGTVLVDTLIPCVIVQFHSFANKTEFKQAMETGLSYYAQHSTPEAPWGWIGDVRYMSAIPKQVQEWLVMDWNPRAFQVGIREVSVVQAENVLGELATQEYVRNTASHRSQYEIRSVYYPSLQAAKQGARHALRRQPEML